ncbi:hypothetical protein Lepto7375DRAFT_0738 [Leptolyngbya sp. PCC 7375]|nr:hypothetical protein Lepto7375DRAFT_0738 [Leptolyngbya sp. PCC 7375]
MLSKLFGKWSRIKDEQRRDLSNYRKLKQLTTLLLKRLVPYSLFLFFIGLVTYVYIQISPDIVGAIFGIFLFSIVFIFSIIRDILTYLTTIYVTKNNTVLLKRLGKIREIDLNNFYRGFCLTSRGYRHKIQVYYEFILLESDQEWIIIDPSFLSVSDKEYLLYAIDQKVDDFRIEKIPNPRDL